jgi:hypothetical protein
MRHLVSWCRTVSKPEFSFVAADLTVVLWVADPPGAANAFPTDRALCGKAGLAQWLADPADRVFGYPGECAWIADSPSSAVIPASLMLQSPVRPEEDNFPVCDLKKLAEATELINLEIRNQ